MKTTLQNLFSAAAIAVLVGAGFAWAQSPGQPSTLTLPRGTSEALTRVCIYPAGGWTTINSDNSGANLSGQLKTWASYAIQCDSDAYIAWGASTAAADSSDGWLAAGSIVRFGTGGYDYVSVLNKTHATADCHYIECL